jgi:hypothetical protein
MKTLIYASSMWKAVDGRKAQVEVKFIFIS